MPDGNASTGMDNDVLIIIGITAVFVAMFGIIYYLYNKYSVEKEVESEYDDSKNNVRIQVNTDTNKAIVNYLNTLKVVQGTDLTKLEESMKDFVTDLVNKQTRRIRANELAIDKNTDDITVNRVQRNKNKSDIARLNDDMSFLRKGISFDTAKIILKFVSEYEKKYTIISSQKNMLINTNMMGLFDPVIFGLFDKYSDAPDVFVERHKDALMSITNKLFTELKIMNFYVNMDNLEHTGYNSLKPHIYTYIETNKDNISFESHSKTSFIVNEYMPKLISYLISNKLQIFEDIDTLMLNYFETVPEVTYFNEFLTNVNIENVIENNDHLFVKCMQKLTEGLDTTWANLKQRVLNNTAIFNTYENKLLFVLIPEYLMMMQYNTDNLSKYNRYVNSQYFMDMPSNYLNQQNLKYFYSILKMFTCDDNHTNIRNEALKIILSDTLAALCTSKHRKFVTEFLEGYKAVVRANPSVFDDYESYMLDYNDFICDAPADFDIDTYCGTGESSTTPSS
jgi:hypothetical protein